MNTPIHPGNLNTFCEVYREELEKSHRLNPNKYAWSISELDEVAKRMFGAFERGTFNKDSEAVKATCKQLKIKHTYKAIKEFISL